MTLVEYKKVFLKYAPIESYAAGLELTGQEVKSLRQKHGSLDGAHGIVPATLTTRNRSGNCLECGAIWHRQTRKIYFQTALLHIIVGQDEMVSQSEVHRAKVGRHASRFLQGDFSQRAVIDVSLFHRSDVFRLVEFVVSRC